MVKDMIKDYLNKVLSYIKNKEVKKEIELELFDHMDEYESLYREIGYGENEASEIAEEKMGNADVVGEQFKATLKRKNKRYAVQLSLTVLLFVLAVINYHYFLSYFSTGLIYPRIFHFLFISAACVMTAFFVKEKRIVGTALSGAFCGFIILTGPYDLPELIGALITGRSYFYSLFSGPSFESSLYYYTTSAFNNCVIFVILVELVFVAAVFVAGLATVIKTKRLKNSKGDVIVGRRVFSCLIVFAVINIFLAAGITAATALSIERIKAQAAQELKQADELIIDNIDYLIKADEENIVAFLEKEYEADTLRNIAYSRSGYVEIDWFVSESEEKGKYRGINAKCYLYNPFNEDYIDVTSTADIDLNPKKATIADAPLPAEISASKSRESNSFEFYYGDSRQRYLFYGNSPNEMLSDESSNENSQAAEINSSFLSTSLSLYDSSDSSYIQSVELTEKQKMIFNCKVYEEYYEEPASTSEGLELKGDYLDYDAYENSSYFGDNPDSSGVSGTYTEIYEVKYIEEYDTYKIKFSYCNYIYLIRSGLYDLLRYDTSVVCDGGIYYAYVRFSENNAFVNFCGLSDAIDSIDTVGKIDEYNSISIEKRLIDDINYKLAYIK